MAFPAPPVAGHAARPAVLPPNPENTIHWAIKNAALTCMMVFTRLLAMYVLVIVPILVPIAKLVCAFAPTLICISVLPTFLLLSYIFMGLYIPYFTHDGIQKTFTVSHLERDPTRFLSGALLAFNLKNGMSLKYIEGLNFLDYTLANTNPDLETIDTILSHTGSLTPETTMARYIRNTHRIAYHRGHTTFFHNLVTQNLIFKLMGKHLVPCQYLIDRNLGGINPEHFNSWVANYSIGVVDRYPSYDLLQILNDALFPKPKIERDEEPSSSSSKGNDITVISKCILDYFMPDSSNLVSIQEFINNYRDQYLAK